VETQGLAYFFNTQAIVFVVNDVENNVNLNKIYNKINNKK